MSTDQIDLEKIHPELRDVYRRMPNVPMHNRLFLGLFNRLAKYVIKSPKPVDGVTITNQVIGSASVRIYRPCGELSGAGLLWIHGGGLIAGSVDMNDRDCSLYARDLNLVVVSVDYRLAPRHRFPSALDDCVSAWYWFQASALTLGVDPERIAVSGQSAGGGLAASLVQQLAAEGGIQPAAQALVYPMLDDRTAARQELDALKHPMWNNRCNRAGWSWYLGQAPGAADLPAYSSAARQIDLTDLPTAWIGVGEIDLFYPENCEYAARLQQAGVSCQLVSVPMAPHGFEAVAPRTAVARKFRADFAQFLREVLTLA